MATDIHRKVSTGPGAAGGEEGRAVAVRARGLVREFGGRRVIDNLELALGPGRFVALLGRSGPARG